MLTQKRYRERWSKEKRCKNIATREKSDEEEKRQEFWLCSFAINRARTIHDMIL